MATSIFSAVEVEATVDVVEVAVEVAVEVVFVQPTIPAPANRQTAANMTDFFIQVLSSFLYELS
jgi:hypothetical protein